MVTEQEALDRHEKAKGKIETLGKVRIETNEDLATYYTPGVAYVSLAIKGNAENAYKYTSKANTVAIINDGTRVLGLGDIGPEAGLPVMEGKALLYKKFGGVDAVPICIGTKDQEEIIKFAENIAPTFGCIAIEDIKAPKSLEIVDRLSASLDIPVFHDDQYGVAAVVAAGLMNSLKLAGKRMKDAKVVVNGAGSAGIGIAKMLHGLGVKRLYVLDTSGLIYKGRDNDMNKAKERIADISNGERAQGCLEEAVNGADALIGVSVKGAFNPGMISSMGSKPIVFALSNPYPEIEYEAAKEAGAFVAATGRSDTPNSINNLVAFPGIVRGLLDARARRVDYKMLADVAITISRGAGRKLSPEYVVPSMGDRKVSGKLTAAIAATVAESAARSGAARVGIGYEEERKRTLDLIKRYGRIERRAIQGG